MYLNHLALTNFKNYESAEMDLSMKVNCFVGNNAAGKTNILDAIYYLSFCKSYFNAADNQNIRHEADYFTVHGTYKGQEKGEMKISCVQKRGMKKSFRYNKKEYDRLADHIGKIPLVMISPYDRDLINEGSDVRRKYLDGVISQFDWLYLSDVIDYNKALLQRNTLLKMFADRGYYDETSLLVWNEKIVELGTRMFDARKKFLTEFNPLFEEYYNYLSENREQVEIIYESQLSLNPLGDLLLESIEKDRMLRYTTCGPHKDDLVFMINGYPVKKFGSQGQQKTFVVAIKLAQFEYTRRAVGFKPILLFDDIFDKLDDNRVEKIVHLVNEDNFGQVFITDTQRQRIESIFKGVNIDHKIFRVADKKVTATDE